MRAKNGSTILSGMIVVFCLAIVSSGCGSNGGSSAGPIVGPSPTPLAGDYAVTATVTSDTCGMGSPETTTANVRLAPGGSGLQMTQTLVNGMCDTYDAAQSGSVLTQSRTDTLVYGGCTLQLQTTSTLTFTGSHFDSVETRHYDYYSGVCPAFTPCDVVTEGQGDACTNCFPGCVSAPAQSGAGSSRPAVHVSGVDE